MLNGKWSQTNASAAQPQNLTCCAMAPTQECYVLASEASLPNPMNSIKPHGTENWSSFSDTRTLLEPEFSPVIEAAVAESG
jgi:hypothetical protein